MKARVTGTKVTEISLYRFIQNVRRHCTEHVCWQTRESLLLGNLTCLSGEGCLGPPHRWCSGDEPRFSIRVQLESALASAGDKGIRKKPHGWCFSSSRLSPEQPQYSQGSRDPWVPPTGMSTNLPKPMTNETTAKERSHSVRMGFTLK